MVGYGAILLDVVEMSGETLSQLQSMLQYGNCKAHGSLAGVAIIH